MHTQFLQSLTARLRREHCPPDVMNRVRQRIREENRLRRHGTTGEWLRMSLGRWAVAGTFLMLVALGGIAQIRMKHAEQARRAEHDRQIAQLTQERAIVAAQAHVALGVIGQALLQASAQTEQTLLQEAMPPLRNGLQIAREKLTQTIKL